MSAWRHRASQGLKINEIAAQSHPTRRSSDHLIISLRCCTAVPHSPLARGQNKHDWVRSSVFYMELLTGGVMLIVGLLLVTFRWPELCQVRAQTGIDRKINTAV